VDPVDRYMYMTPARASVAAERIVDYYKSQGLTRMGIWYASDNAFASTGYQATKKLGQQAGVSFVDDESFSARDTTDFTPLLTKLRSSNAQGLLVWVTGAPAVAITKQFRAQGLTVPLFFSHAEATPLYYGANAAGPGANGVVFPTQLGIISSYLPDGLQVKKVATDMIHAYQQANGGASPPQFAYDGWIAMMLLADAMKRKGTSTSQILEGLNSANLVTPQGVYKMTGQDHSGFPVQYMQVAQIQNNAPSPTPYSLDLLRKLS
jgi:branched-chain amino acid transport system substrate-binding protein